MFNNSFGRSEPGDDMYYNDYEAELPSSGEPKGSLWAPTLILILMIAIGTVVYIHSQKSHTVSPTPWFSIHDGILSFDENKYAGSAELEIPSSVDGQVVTALGDYCFQNCDSLTTVILPDNLESIGKGAFYDCDNLRGIKGTEELSSIGAQAFYSCGALEAIYIPGSVETIGQSAFGECGKLQHIFYGGKNQDWNSLYPEKINQNTQIYPVEGSSPNDFRKP